MEIIDYYTIDGEIIAENSSVVGRRDYLPDALGSTSSMVVGGAVENGYTFAPTGRILSKIGFGLDPAFLWVGSYGYRSSLRQYAEVYVRSRTYSSSVSRWSSVDPFWPDEPANVYAGDKFLTAIDPSGGQGPGQILPGPFDNDPWEVWRKAFRDRGLVDPPTLPKRLLSDCGLCAASIIMDTWFRPVHHDNAGYTHCMACCYLTKAFSAECAMTMQIKQNNTPGFGGTPVQKANRIRFCREGIWVAQHWNASCHNGCSYKHHVGRSGKKPVELTFAALAGC